MSIDNALALSRHQTRERLMRSLYRANARQQAVARRRTMLRQLLWMARWACAFVIVVVLLVWAGMQSGALPQYRLVTVERLSVPAAVAQVPAQKRYRTESSEPAPQKFNGTSPELVTKDQPADAQSPIDLKAETQLNSLMQ